MIFKPFKDLEKYFYGEISLDEFVDSYISEMEAGIRSAAEDGYEYNFI